MELQEFVDSAVEDFGESFTDIFSKNIIHDQYQFESKFDFDLKPHANETEKHYSIDLYFFIPKNMGIHGDTYTRENFYSDLNNYLRIQTPELFKWHKIVQSEWKLPLSDQYMAVHLHTEKRQRLAGAVVQEVKFFGCFVDTQLKQLQSSFLRVLERNFFTRSNWVEAMSKRIQMVLDIIQVYRVKYLNPIKQQKILLDLEVKRAFLLVDEFISYRVEIVLIQLAEALQQQNPGCINVQYILTEALTQEANYRAKSRESNFDEVKKREIYYYRLGLLKKYVLEVLYLQSKNIKKEKTYRNAIAAVGAALAATWAGLADIQRFQLLGNGNGQDAWLRLVAILLLGVIAYVFKDRIKELSKEYFNQRLKQYLPDFDILMFYKYFQENGVEKQNFIGSCKEFFRYLQKDALPPEIAYIRDIGNRSELDPSRDEVIMHYSKRLVLHIDEQRVPNIQFIRDIARFDFTEFLNKLDDPDKEMSYFDQSKGIVRMEAPKVYHINLVLRYSCNYKKNKTTSEYHVEYERVRIILNKRGILRVEPVLNRGELNDSGQPGLEAIS